MFREVELLVCGAPRLSGKRHQHHQYHHHNHHHHMFTLILVQDQQVGPFLPRTAVSLFPDVTLVLSLSLDTVLNPPCLRLHLHSLPFNLFCLQCHFHCALVFTGHALSTLPQSCLTHVLHYTYSSQPPHLSTPCSICHRHIQQKLPRICRGEKNTLI